ncbi:hypothetical protein G7046_g7700 [Stylonectria norvegica]|nr:hypothetical protein G7046_g7700 [Stylonectria norvegica]
MNRFAPLRMALVRRGAGVRRGYATKPPSVTAQFYKQFTRPIAKVGLLAVFTYQFLYWGWLRLETDEIRAERDATIAGLEAKVEEYEKTKTGETVEDMKSA